MDMLKRTFTKRYFFHMILFFVLWYIGSLLIFTLYQTKPSMILYVALNMYYPVLFALFAYSYFRGSVNDWNDRFRVAFGWIAFALIASALLVQPVYGYDWTHILNLEVIKANWIGVFVTILAAMFARKKIRT